MTTMSGGTTIGELVVEVPARARVLERLGIDYCCGGRRPLSEACAELGLDVDEVLGQLGAVGASARSEQGRDPAAATMSDLIEDIELTHHAYLREELPRLAAITRKVAQVHGGSRPELNRLRDVFLAFAEGLMEHMEKEEGVLFPWIRGLEAGGGAGERLSDAAEIDELMGEHEHAGRALATMRELTGGYVPPLDACNTYRAMLDGLAELERDMHWHVHKENNVLFPRAQHAAAAGREG